MIAGANPTRITMLNSMASTDFAESLDLQKQWGVRVLDLKGDILGKALLDLTDAEAAEAKRLADERGLSVYCLSSGLFFDFVEEGEAHFRERHLARVDRLAALAGILKPSLVRLLAARTRRREELADSISYLCEAHPWLFDLYRAAIDRLAEAGFKVTIENEVHGCVLSKPEEVRGFFAELDRGDRVSFTWDVQNMWQMGTFPSLEVYDGMKDLIGYYHLKGGRSEEGGRELKWRSSLEEASWPVLEITRRAVADGVPAICLNPSHGEAPDGFDAQETARRDLDFVRENIEGVE